MIVKGIEVERHNLSSIGLSTLRDIQATLAHNVGQLWGDVTEEKLLMKLISIEIKRKVKVENINLAAKKESERTIKIGTQSRYRASHLNHYPEMIIRLTEQFLTRRWVIAKKTS